MYMAENKNSASQKSKTIKADRKLFPPAFLYQRTRAEMLTWKIFWVRSSHQYHSNWQARLGTYVRQIRSWCKEFTSEVLPVSALKTCCSIDGQALVQAIGKPTWAKSFGDLADALNTSVFSHFNQNCPRVNVVFYRYRKTSIKFGTRSKREGRMRSIRRKIDSQNHSTTCNPEAVHVLAWKQNKSHIHSPHSTDDGGTKDPASSAIWSLQVGLNNKTDVASS